MLLLLYWIYFVIFSSQFFTSLRLLHYLLFSGLMLVINTVYNKNIRTNMGFKNSVLLLLIPYSVYWYMIIIFNAFLIVHPFSYDFIIFILFFLTYLIIYLFWELN